MPLLLSGGLSLAVSAFVPAWCSGFDLPISSFPLPTNSAGTIRRAATWCGASPADLSPFFTACIPRYLSTGQAMVRYHTTAAPISPSVPCREFPLAASVELNRFLADVERRAYRMAFLATGNQDDALDIVQDACTICQALTTKPENCAAALPRGLQSRITDWHRRTWSQPAAHWFASGQGWEEEGLLWRRWPIPSGQHLLLLRTGSWGEAGQGESADCRCASTGLPASGRGRAGRG